MASNAEHEALGDQSDEEEEQQQQQQEDGEQEEVRVMHVT